MTLIEAFPHCQICPFVEDPPAEDVAWRIHQGEAWLVTLRRNQALLGSAFITLRNHKESLVDLSSQEEREFTVMRNRLITAADMAFGADGVNISCLMNYAFRPTADPEFRPQPHVHYHFKPRYSEPRIVAGEEFSDPEFGNYLREVREQNVSLELGAIIAAQMKAHF